MKCKMNVYVNLAVNEISNVKAHATVCFEDSFKVEGIRLVNGKNGLFMSMPSYRSGSGLEGAYKNICSPNKELGKEMQENLIEAYHNAVADAKDTGKGSSSIVFGTSEPLKVSGVRVSLLNERENLKGLATVTLNDCFYVNNIRIFEKEGKEFISHPSYKKASPLEGGKDEYKDLCYPVTAEFRNELMDNIKKEYRQQNEQKEQKLAGEGEWLPIPEGADLPITPEAEKNKDFQRKNKPPAR